MEQYAVILGIAILYVRPGQGQAFEAAFRQASPIIASIPGYLGHELQRCLEAGDKYVLPVRWETLGDHTVGFPGSARYQEWKALLHHFYDPFPVVEHSESVEDGPASPSFRAKPRNLPERSGGVRLSAPYHETQGDSSTSSE